MSSTKKSTADREKVMTTCLLAKCSIFWVAVDRCVIHCFNSWHFLFPFIDLDVVDVVWCNDVRDDARVEWRKWIGIHFEFSLAQSGINDVCVSVWVCQCPCVRVSVSVCVSQVKRSTFLSSLSLSRSTFLSPVREHCVDVVSKLSDVQELLIFKHA